MSERPRPHTLRIEGNRSLLYSRARRTYVPLSGAESFLLVASREVGIDAAAALLAERLGAEASERALAAVLATGAVGDAGRFEGRVIELGAAVEAGFAAPLVAHLGVTQACNYACQHCYSSSGKRAPDELGRGEIEALLRELADIGCMKVVFGGGEPFLRRDLVDLLGVGDALGIDCFVHTNGSMLTPELVAELQRCPPAELAVSLDGDSEVANDAIRGRGSFTRTLAGVAHLSAYAPGFNISLTVTPANAATVPSIVELARDVGAKLLLLRPAYPAGNALRASSLACDRDTFSRTVELARARGAEVGLEVDAPHPDDGAEPAFEGFGCVAGKVVVGISPRGEVTPCLNLPDSYVAGSVRGEGLLYLWQRGGSFGAIRALEPNSQCASCRHYDTCRGGCRVRALGRDEGLGAPDTWCHYEPRDGVEAPGAPASLSPRGDSGRLRVLA